MKSLLHLSFLGILLTLLSGCFGSNEPQVEKQTKQNVRENLVVGFSADYPPLVFKKEGKLQGIEVDFAHEIAKSLDLNVSFKNMPWSELYFALKRGEIDVVMSGVSITKRREKYVSFSDSYLSISQMALMRETSLGLDLVQDGKNQRVGVVEFTTAQQYANMALPLATQNIYVTPSEGLRALLNGDIEYYISDSPAIWYYSSHMKLDGLIGYYVPMTSERLAWAVLDKNVYLLQKLNNELVKMKKSGKYSQIISKWINYKIVQMPRGKIVRFD